MMLKKIIWILGWKLKVISNLNSPSRILKNYLKKIVHVLLFQFYFCHNPFLCLYFKFVLAHLPLYVFVLILYLSQSFLCIYFSFSYPLPSSFNFFYASFYHSIYVPSFFLSLFHFVPLHFVFFCCLFIYPCLLSICWLFSLFFSTLILDCPCMFLFSSLSSLILLFASSLTLSKLVYDVTNGPSKVINSESKSNLTMMNYQ
jgi:hypothetical protein